MRISIFILFIFAFSNGYSQSLTPEVVNSSGGFGSNSSFSLSYAVGEAVITTINNSNNILTQGFLQTEDSVITEIEKAVSIENLTYYPNPVREVLNIKTNNTSIRNIAVYDVLGKLQYTLDYSSQIALTNLAAGFYLVRLTDNNNNLISTFKICKL
ncbi:MAG: T9SS type A sorting domain-containing protein [Bacteroidetes bacterium]|nr:T9SS type A sorting domain-containing protein [Bacteroidota bacterium]